MTQASSKYSARQNNRSLLPSGAFFFLFGSLFVWAFLIRPYVKVRAAKSWTENYCTVISSAVGKHTDSDGDTTYSIDIAYEYEVDGQRFRSKRFDFMGGSSSGYARKRAAVAEYPGGKVVPCFFDPERPSEAVLNREFSGDLRPGLLSLVFPLAGIGMMVAGLRSKKSQLAAGETSARAAISGEPGRFFSRPYVGGCSRPGVRLAPATSPKERLLASLFFCLFWNGMVSVFLVDVVDSFQYGRPDWFQALVLTPFVLAGVASIGAIFYFALSLSNPRPSVEIVPGSPRAGERVSMRWLLSGNLSKVTSLSISITGKERIESERGSRTATKDHKFAEFSILQTTNPLDMSEGEAVFTLPIDSVPTSENLNSQIIWSVVIRGEIPNLPDMKEEFPFKLLPAA